MRRTTGILILSVLILTALGMVMLASTSALQGASMFKDPHYFVKRQAAALIVGLVGAVVAARIRYHVWRRLAIVLAVVSAVLLFAVLIPGVGVAVKGSKRWISLGVTTFQPSELAKIAMVFLLAWWVSHYVRRMKELWVGLAAPLLLVGVMLILVMGEPDYGTTTLLALVAFAMLWAGGTRFAPLFISGVMGASAMTLLVMHNPVRMRRIIAFINPERYADQEAFQLLNAIYAFVMGGSRGAGLGASLQKRFYLPEAHTDFIFAIIAEELGLVASLGVLLLFVVIFFCGLRISSRAPDTFGRLMALGLTCMLAMQAAFNIGVVTGVLPTKGIALPFISYGGTSLVTSLAMVGLLLAVAREAGDDGDSALAVVRKQSGRF
ncbi:MAG: putative lipid II flippase FtsW [Kiritimatiellae bacterium]|nr:putative lipid II flippase FtsW [Kiritimatiellia bacterium]MCO6401190.1 putative lipid II flippase FtsW [Verrucomicrobiota bacterium]